MALRPSGLVIGIPYKLAPAALRSGQGVFNPLVGTGRVQNCVEFVGFVGQIIISDSVIAIFLF